MEVFKIGERYYFHFYTTDLFYHCAVFELETDKVLEFYSSALSTFNSLTEFINYVESDHKKNY